VRAMPAIRGGPGCLGAAPQVRARFVPRDHASRGSPTLGTVSDDASAAETGRQSNSAIPRRTART
jgi:hypothetical protein